MKIKTGITLVALMTAGTITTAFAQGPGADIYKTKCQMCHGATGMGDTPAGKAMGAHAFNSPDVIKQSNADLTAIIKNGKGKMPAFAGKLTDAEMAALVTYIRALQK